MPRTNGKKTRYNDRFIYSQIHKMQKLLTA